jgi:hypothetical protein
MNVGRKNRLEQISRIDVTRKIGETKSAKKRTVAAEFQHEKGTVGATRRTQKKKKTEESLFSLSVAEHADDRLTDWPGKKKKKKLRPTPRTGIEYMSTEEGGVKSKTRLSKHNEKKSAVRAAEKRGKRTKHRELRDSKQASQKQNKKGT